MSGTSYNAEICIYATAMACKTRNLLPMRSRDLNGAVAVDHGGYSHYGVAWCGVVFCSPYRGLHCLGKKKCVCVGGPLYFVPTH